MGYDKVHQLQELHRKVLLATGELNSVYDRVSSTLSEVDNVFQTFSRLRNEAIALDKAILEALEKLKTEKIKTEIPDE